MAERRMFAKTIIDSDAFLDMPLSAQALYFHLSMRADDEGFINNPKKIQRMVGAADDDMKVLVSKNFVIPFETGIVVIKHWRIHNYIRADRLVETKYKDERALLDVKDNGAYTLNGELLEIEDMSGEEMRKRAYENSTLPYSFIYKIRRAFDGKKCPVCGEKMTSSYIPCTPSVQHNIPISKGGEHEIYNISVICRSCNSRIRDKETEELNNREVADIWDRIVYAETHDIKWFDNPKLLDDIDVSQMSVKCQSNVSIGKDSIGKDSIGKVNNKGRFVKPTVEEVRAYCQERNNGIDAESFVDYYESKGWLIGKNHMKDWKAAVRTWENRRKGEANGNVGRVPRADEEQRNKELDEYIKRQQAGEFDDEDAELRRIWDE